MPRRKPSILARVRHALANRHLLTGLGIVGSSFGALAGLGYPKWTAGVAAVVGVYVAGMHQAPKAPKQ